MSDIPKVKIGLEVHIQLSGEKLFCRCSTESPAEEKGRIFRILGTTSGETGGTDPAVVYERKRSRSFNYIVTDNSCLVEADEEPPGELNREALTRAIAESIHLKCGILDRIQFMRKIVVDGSNTSGFQRTAIVGIGGSVSVESGNVRISTLCLEEDSCRKVEQDGRSVLYSLDRLGIPLMEISTEPDIKSPEHAREVAEAIGDSVIAAGWVRHGADGIRQDVNFSMGYGRVEIKGVQKLSDIESSIRYEMQRQGGLKKVSDVFLEKGVPSINLVETKEIFEHTSSNVIRKSIRNGLNVYISSLKNCSGLLKNGDLRLGKDLSDIVKAFGGGGLMHSDELPSFGIEEEIPAIKGILDCGEDDAFLIVTSSPDRKTLIENELNIRIKKIASMDLSETRFLNNDGTTSFLRPLPGGSRMYPETDVPVIESGYLMEEAKKMVPRTLKVMADDLSRGYGISGQDAETVVRKGLLREFTSLSAALDNGSMAARILLQMIPELSRDTGIEIRVNDVLDLILSAGSHTFNREIIEQAMKMRFKENLPESDIWAKVDEGFLSGKELKEIIKKVASQADSSEKNVIPRIRSLTAKKFNPAEAIEIFQGIKENS